MPRDVPAWKWDSPSPPTYGENPVGMGQKSVVGIGMGTTRMGIGMILILYGNIIPMHNSTGCG